MKNIVTLNKEEQRIAKFIARSRFESNRSQGVLDKRMGLQTCEFTDLEGFAGEMAFSKIINSYPDFSVSIRQEGWDVLLNDWRVDVKTTSYTKGHLLVGRWKKKNDVDIYALMVGSFPKYKFVGWIPSNHITEDKYLEDIGRGKTLVVRQRFLFKPENILKYDGKMEPEIEVPF